MGKRGGGGGRRGKSRRRGDKCLQAEEKEVGRISTQVGIREETQKSDEEER